MVTRVFRPSPMQIIGFIIAVIVIYYRIDKRQTIIQNTYDELEYRLKAIYPKPENFHMDADLINIFYNVRDLRKFHSEGYDNAVVAIDNMLKIESEMEGGVYHCKENLDVMRDQMGKALNQMHSVIFKIPAHLPYDRKHKRTLNALQIILRRHIDNMVELCKKQQDARGINIDWHPLLNSGPRPDDTKKTEYSGFDFYYTS